MNDRTKAAHGHLTAAQTALDAAEAPSNLNYRAEDIARAQVAATMAQAEATLALVSVLEGMADDVDRIESEMPRIRGALSMGGR